MVSHHKNCSGWTSSADYIPCTHCGARFKQFRSIQTHNEKCHNNLFRFIALPSRVTRHILLFSNTSTSQSNSQSSVETRSWCSPPPLPVTPDIVPRCLHISSYRLLLYFSRCDRFPKIFTVKDTANPPPPLQLSLAQWPCPRPPRPPTRS